MSKTLKQIVKDIQYHNDWTVEQVAESIGYSRVHLTKEMAKGDNAELKKLLLEKHGQTLQNVSPGVGLDTRLPLGDLNLTIRDYIELLKDSERKAQENIQRLERILEGQINKIVTNSDLIVAGQYKVALETEAMGAVALESLARLEKKPEAALKKEADKRKIDRILAAQKQGMKP